MEETLTTLLVLGTGLAIFLFFADQVFNFIIFIFSGPLRAALTILFFYMVFFTNIGMFIRPYFTPMEKWSEYNEVYAYHFSGTGAFVNPNDIITNDHVVAECEGIKIRTKDKVYDGEVVATDKKWDLAIIRTRANSPVYSVIRKEPHQPEEEIIYPDYKTDPGVFREKEGEVLTLEQLTPEDRDIAKQGQEVFFNGYIRQGNSGSPLYDTKGYLIGVIKAAIIQFDPFYTGESAQLASGVLPVTDFLYRYAIPHSRAKDHERDYFEQEGYRSHFAVGVLCGEEK